MNLCEALKNLIGHEVFVDTTVEDAEREIPGGTLAEIGSDYIMIDTEKEEETGYVNAAAHWYVRLATVVSVGHPSDCRRCAIEAAEARSTK